MYKSITLLLALCFLFSTMATAQDVAGSKDHSVINRYLNSTIKFYYQKAYNEVKMVTAASKGEPTKTFKAKGKHTSILYAGPEGRSIIEIFRNYEQAIRDAEGEILFSCTGQYAPEGCDAYKSYFSLKFFDNVYSSRRNSTDQYLYMEGGSENQAFLTAKIEQPTAIIYIEIGITGKFLGHPTSIQVEIVEEKKMDTGLITVDKIANAIRQKGKIALYGIYFDTGSSTLKSTSKATLSALTTYLKANSSLNFYVVGHTDDTGNFENNQQLSKARAEAVKTYLMQQGIASSRLISDGAGPLAPIATNDTSEGQQLNRRVELVKRIK